MRDALHVFGNLSLAVKDTEVYSADECDLGGIDSGSRLSKKTLPGDLFICFRNTTALAAADSYVPACQVADDSAFTTNAEKVTFPETAAELPAGTIIRHRVPAEVRRYIRAAAIPKSTGVFTAETVESWLELGAQQL